MTISAINSFPMMYHFQLQLSNDPQSRYSIITVNIPVKPVYQPSVVSVSSVEGLSAVPDEIQEDTFFQDNTDPISFAPLFDPVADKNNPKHIYERESIVTWLQMHHTSPMTRQAMTVDDLVDVPELKKRLIKRLKNSCRKSSQRCKLAMKRCKKKNMSWQ